MSNRTLDLDKLEQLARAATPGPWWADLHQVQSDRWCEECRSKETMSVLSDDHFADREESTVNAQYIAALNPETCLELIERMRDLERRVERWECEEIDRATCCWRVEQERDRYRSALELIASAECKDGIYDPQYWASEALAGEGE